MLNAESSPRASDAPAAISTSDTVDAAHALARVISGVPMSGRWISIHVLAHIVGRAARRGGEVALSQAKIAQELKLEPHQVEKAITQVRKLPGIELVTSKGRASVWRLSTGGR